MTVGVGAPLAPKLGGRRMYQAASGTLLGAMTDSHRFFRGLLCGLALVVPMWAALALTVVWLT